jgi:prolyl oligopeptidase PreP (S9A serine peptidase family)
MKVYYHYIGTEQKDDILIYQNKEQPEWIFGADLTQDGKYLLISSMKGTDKKNLLHYVDVSEKVNVTAKIANSLAQAQENSAMNQEDPSPSENASESTADEETKNYITFTELPELKPLIPEWKGEFNYLHNNGTKFFFQTNF